MATKHEEWRAAVGACKAVLDAHKKWNSRLNGVSGNSKNLDFSAVPPSLGLMTSQKALLEAIANMITAMLGPAVARDHEAVMDRFPDTSVFAQRLEPGSPYDGITVGAVMEAGWRLREEASQWKARAETALKRGLREPSDAVEQRKLERQNWILEVLREHRTRPMSIAQLLGWLAEDGALSISHKTLSTDLRAIVSRDSAKRGELPPLGDS